MSKIVNYYKIEQIIVNEDINHFSKLFFEKVKERLKRSYIFKIEEKKQILEFKGSIFRFVWNGWDLFNTISKGRIQFLTLDEVKYIKHEINFKETLIIALLFHILPLCALAFEPTISLIIVGIIWFLYLLSYLVSSIRFSSYIGKTLAEVNKISGYKKGKN